MNESEASQVEDSVFELTTFNGHISVGDCEQSIGFQAHSGADCRLAISLLKVDGPLYIALSKAMGRPGGHSAPVTLSGISSGGVKFVSNDMEVRGTKSGSQGHEVQLETGEASIELPRERSADETLFGLKFSLRGFKSFRPKPVRTRLGLLEVFGWHKDVSPDDVSGGIIVQSGDAPCDDDWFEDAEALADFVWRGLQFGHGGRLQIPLVQEYRQESVVATFYNGRGRPAHLPAIHKLNQSDFIAALASRYESSDPFPDALWQAVGWLNNDSSIDEVRYLTLMTALETILHNLIPEASSTLVSKAVFQPVRDALIETLEGLNLGIQERVVLEQNIKQINRAPISKKLKSVIRKYNLPASAFDDDLIRLLNKQRNSITHQGKSLEGENLWDCILHAREIITRIVFAELRYTGQFESYADGYKQERML